MSKDFMKELRIQSKIVKSRYIDNTIKFKEVKEEAFLGIFKNLRISYYKVKYDIYVYIAKTIKLLFRLILSALY